MNEDWQYTIIPENVHVRGPGGELMEGRKAWRVEYWKRGRNADHFVILDGSPPARDEVLTMIEFLRT